MPPEVRARLSKALATRWPLQQSKRDKIMVLVAQKMAALRGVVIPEIVVLGAEVPQGDLW
jgi:hypothetical protein